MGVVGDRQTGSEAAFEGLRWSRAVSQTWPRPVHGTVAAGLPTQAEKLRVRSATRIRLHELPRRPAL